MKVKDLPKPLRDFILKYLWFRGAIVYAYSCYIPEEDARDLWAYVGQTRQELISRHHQHMGLDPRQAGQPWSDLYPEVRVIWQGSCPNFALDLIEKYYIKKHKPLFNYIHNLKNPRRITRYDAKTARATRDRLARTRRLW